MVQNSGDHENHRLDVKKKLVNNGDFNWPTLNWWVDPGFLVAINQWLFLVPIKGGSGRWHITPQVRQYKPPFKGTKNNPWINRIPLLSKSAAATKVALILEAHTSPSRAEVKSAHSLRYSRTNPAAPAAKPQLWEVPLLRCYTPEV